MFRPLAMAVAGGQLPAGDQSGTAGRPPPSGFTSLASHLDNLENQGCKSAERSEKNADVTERHRRFSVVRTRYCARLGIYSLRPANPSESGMSAGVFHKGSAGQDPPAGYARRLNSSMISYEMQMPNGAIARWHKIVKWELTPETTHAVVTSYASQAMELLAWQDTYTIPLDYKISTIADVEFILTQPLAPMAGGSIVPDDVTTVQCAQARKWAETKIEENRRRSGVFTTSRGTIQIDDRSTTALENVKLILLTPDATVDWTMADNASQSLTSADIDIMLAEVVRFQTNVHAVSQALRLAIYADDISIEEVEAIDVAAYGWPAATVEIEDETPSAPEDGSETTE